MLIGSRAMKHWFPDFREPKDTDHFSSVPIDGAETFWHPAFPVQWDQKAAVASPNLLYTIKVSHAPWDLHGTWNKHMHDILFLQSQKKRFPGIEFDRESYDILFSVWKEKHGKKRVNLNKTKDDFFGDAVVRKYDHDSLHDSVAYDDAPMYTRILKDGSDVLVDNNKFWSMSHEDKIKTIREEVYATALERWVIPSDYTVSPRAAYARAMKKSITSLFKNEWALFIVLNYSELYKPDMNYVQHHRSKSHKLILL